MAEYLPYDVKIAAHLIEGGVLDRQRIEEGLLLAKQWNVRLAEVIFARGWMTSHDYFRELARHHGTAYVDLSENPADHTLLDRQDAAFYAKHLILPWRQEDNRTVIVTADPSPATFAVIRKRYGSRVGIAVTCKFDIVHAVNELYADDFTRSAVSELAERDPEMSARTVITTQQAIVLYGVFTLFMIGLALAPWPTLTALIAVMSLFYLGNFAFKLSLVWAGGMGEKRKNETLALQAKALRDEDLPIFTILVPMFKEPEVLPILANALRHLDYPLGKLDIKLVLEQSDTETIAAARALNLEAIFEVIIVPPSKPQTKPKACNYALKFARGDYVVIFDAEDKPEPDQLRKVVAAFQALPAETACIQCRLNYYNGDENWLTRMFTLDYSLWFDLMLPGLQKLNIPIPLGGTSNHFKTSVLQELYAWDPYNVTEDADLGIRLTQKGYRVSVIDSTTFEEANCDIGNWIRQRSRWIKGYMQTFLVHTRRPVHLLKTIGPLGVIGFIFFIGGTMLTGILNPIFWLIFAVWLITATAGFDQLFPPALLLLSLVNLLIGNALFIYLMMVAPFRRKKLDLVLFAPTVVGYWALISIAAYKGFWQLIKNPFYWEKTQHGISSHTAKELIAAKLATGPMPLGPKP